MASTHRPRFVCSYCALDLLQPYEGRMRCFTCGSDDPSVPFTPNAAQPVDRPYAYELA